MNINKNLTCSQCLKYAVCISKDELQCDDLVGWLMEYNVMVKEFRKRLASFEVLWGREVSVILAKSLTLYFKKKRNHHSCAIVKNM